MQSMPDFPTFRRRLFLKELKSYSCWHGSMSLESIWLLGPGHATDCLNHPEPQIASPDTPELLHVQNPES